MNSLEEWLTQLSDAPDPLNMFSRSMLSATPSTPQRVRVMPWKAALLSRTGIPAPIVPELSYKADLSDSIVKNQTSTIIDGAKLSKQLDQSFMKAVSQSSSTELADEANKWPSTINLDYLRAIMRDIYGKPHPAHWYNDPVDQMLVFMGNAPRPGAKYTVPND